MCVTNKFSSVDSIIEKCMKIFPSRKVGHTRVFESIFRYIKKFPPPIFTCEIRFGKFLYPKECFDEHFSMRNFTFLKFYNEALHRPRLINNKKIEFQNRRKTIKNSLCLLLTRLLIESHFYFRRVQLESDAHCMTN